MNVPNAQSPIAGANTSCDGDTVSGTTMPAELRHRAILESAIDVAIIATDPDGLVTDWNGGAARLFGWSARQMRGHSLDRLHAADEQGRPDRCRRAALDLGVVRDEAWHRRKDGTRFWAGVEIVPLRHATGGLLGFLWVLSDRGGPGRAPTTSGVSLAEQVAERRRERERIWLVSRDLFGVCDATGIWSSINPAWEELLGWTEADILGRPLDWLEHPDEGGGGWAARLRPAPGDDDRPVSFDRPVRSRDGREVWLSWTASPADGMFYCVGREATRDRRSAASLRETQERLHQSQKMETVGQLTGGLAHDFNNLLLSMSGSLELLGLRLGRGQLADASRHLGAAQASAQRAAALTQRLLAFSRRQTLEPRPTVVEELVAGMEELIRRTIGSAIMLEVVAPPGLWQVRVDPNRLENALLNLCINARDAMPAGGRMTICLENRWADETVTGDRDLAPGPYLVLSVTDTGTGMTPEVMAQAFEPFFTTKPAGEGTGLGLSMIHGFTCEAGGVASIKSELGRGTCISLYLPRHTVPADPDASPGQDPEN